jgi:hypothetical protein
MNVRVPGDQDSGPEVSHHTGMSDRPPMQYVKDGPDKVLYPTEKVPLSSAGVNLPSGAKRVELSAADPFESILIKMVETHRRKRQDYSGDFGPLSNFEDTGRQLQLTAGHAVEALIATKQARLRVLLPKLWRNGSHTPANESILDTLMDRAVYAVLAAEIWNDGGYYTKVEQ